LIIEGATEKVSLLIMPMNVLFNKTLVLIYKKYIFEHHREVKTIKTGVPFPVLAGMVLHN
jgi:hypothetical protein